MCTCNSLLLEKGSGAKQIQTNFKNVFYANNFYLIQIDTPHTEIREI